jgi:hypothetical protein
MTTSNATEEELSVHNISHDMTYVVVAHCTGVIGSWGELVLRKVIPK